MRTIDTIIIGAGQTGLAISHGQRGRRQRSVSTTMPPNEKHTPSILAPAGVNGALDAFPRALHDLSTLVPSTGRRRSCIVVAMDEHIDEIHPISRRPDTASEHVTADVVVVGARCAGAATAMLLAQAGHDVVVVDRATSPSDTLSTHAIARGGVVQLQRWGLLDRVLDSGAPALRRIEFHAVDELIVRSVKDRHGVDLLIAPRRHVLDPILQDAAVEAGARLRTGFTVDDVLYDTEGRAVGVAGRYGGRPTEVRARFVVGADGLRSRVARAVGAPIIESHPAVGATHYRYYRGTWPAIEYHLGELGLAGVFPTHGGEGCVWVCTPDAVAVAERRRASSPDEALAASGVTAHVSHARLQHPGGERADPAHRTHFAARSVAIADGWCEGKRTKTALPGMLRW